MPFVRVHGVSIKEALPLATLFQEICKAISVPLFLGWAGGAGLVGHTMTSPGATTQTHVGIPRIWFPRTLSAALAQIHVVLDPPNTVWTGHSILELEAASTPAGTPSVGGGGWELCLTATSSDNRDDGFPTIRPGLAI